ncbi:hypothetical protein [Rubellicoccus peritrichatus]|uniref:Uncharacterized protein n=1 Tax=Rubellicoccus peritrichatus TaxID=3080537 RepID=A0AAQ3QUA5_9BACT|nr:hypothetical protein [Puniceicoccus sp. CR14]WOO42196.1 hypothetical protein RZN69_03780 [Puniceicoccus sp. CR14]
MKKINIAAISLLVLLTVILLVTGKTYLSASILDEFANGIETIGFELGDNEFDSFELKNKGNSDYIIVSQPYLSEHLVIDRFRPHGISDALVKELAGRSKQKESYFAYLIKDSKISAQKELNFNIGLVDMVYIKKIPSETKVQILVWKDEKLVRPIVVLNQDELNNVINESPTAEP